MNSTAVNYREAVGHDAAACIELRGKTRENAVSVERLRQIGITERSWREGIESGRFPGVVSTHNSQIVGYCFGERDTGEILVLALLPAFEGGGIGRSLLTQVVNRLKSLGHRRLFLGASSDPAVRSYGFYRHLGWRSTGETDDNGDDILEFHVN